MCIRDSLYSPGLLPDMEEAVRRICRAVQEKRRLRIVGDYDIDGVCSTAILYKGFKRIGACADYVIPVSYTHLHWTKSEIWSAIMPPKVV